MNQNNLKRHTSLLARIARWFQLFFDDKLYRNATYITASTVVLYGFGFLFWVINARLFTNEQIGLASALISVATLISNFGLLGFNNGIIRFLPTATDQDVYINTSFCIMGVISAALSIIYLLGITFFSPDLVFVRQNMFWATTFVVLMVLSVLNLGVDSVFIAHQRAFYVLIKNILASLVRLILPFVLLSFGAYGMFLAHGISAALGTFVGVVLLIRIVAYRPRVVVTPNVLRRIGPFAMGNHLAAFLFQVPVLTLPVLITNILGPQHAATFYVSVMLAQILYIMPMSMTQSLFAEASHHNDTLIPRLYQAGKFTALIMTPAIIILALFGRYVLLIFGSDYAENGTHLLQLLALSGYFFAFNSLITTVLYVRRRIPLLSAINLTYALCALFLSYAFAHAGLLGIGIAWLVSQSLATVLFATTIIAQEFKHRRHTTQGRAE